MLIKIILIFSAFIAVIYKSKRSLHMLQHNLYNENNRYLKWIKKNFKLFFDHDLIGIAISLIGLFVLYDLNKISNILIVCLSLLYIFVGYVFNKRIVNDQNKKPLVVTKRVKRLIVTVSILYLIPILLLVLNSDGSSTDWLFIFILSLMIYFNNIVVFIANIINHPVERMVYNYYKSKAQKKLKSMSNLKIIGITGSYGKTSSKNILSDILNVKYNALPTPRNLNTYNGLIMTVNNHLDKFDGKICTVYLALHNAKATASGAYYRLMPIDVKLNDSFSMSNDDIAKFAVNYYVSKQFKNEYNADPELELLTAVSNTYIPFENVAITYSSTSEGVTFDNVDGKLIMHLGEANGGVTVKVTANYNGSIFTKDITFNVIIIEIPDTIPVSDAISEPDDTEVIVKGVVMSSLINQTGFYLNDGTGVIAIRTDSETIKNINN